MNLHSFLFLIFWASTPVFIDAQLRGSISIDCGIQEGRDYTDEEVDIDYESDTGYIDTGENRAISWSGSEHLNPMILRTLRTFPEGDRNCYTLKPVFKDDKYLVRAWFFYGNDNRSDGIEIPIFDVYLGMNYWDSISHSDSISPHGKVIEVIVTATRDFIEVCLMRKVGNPYISALELRPLFPGLYTVNEAQTPLILLHRYDLGAKSSEAFMRYSDDPFHRVWTPYPNISNTDPQPPWRVLTTNSSDTFNDSDPAYYPPDEVMRTAVAPLNDTQPLVITSDAKIRDADLLCVYLHLAEVELIENGKVREFTVQIGFDDDIRIRPIYLQTTSISRIISPNRSNINVSLWSTSKSDLPPLLNAIEIYSIDLLWDSSLQTHEDDLDAIIGVKEAYRVKKNWMGDPCLPKNYTWTGLNCTNMPNSKAARIVSLNLSFSGLHGGISDSFANLSALTSLDLSGNNLSGKVPSFLGRMESLRLLNLSRNNFTGVVPSILLDRSKAKLLQLSVDGNPNLTCGSETLCSSKEKARGYKRTNLSVEILVPSSAVLMILGIIFVLWWKLRTRRQNMAATPLDSFSLDSRRFTYEELRRMTKDFSRVIGRGGFGVVYYGQLDDGTHVAVKLISYVCGGSSEFQTEAQLLIRIHHRNLVQFIGYCADGKNKALVLEFMSRGNLDNILTESEKNSIIVSWGQRLRIALDIAQGLEYLHVGCKPPIIHRDVKLTNILLNDKFQAKIADFGVSKVFYNDDSCTHISTLVKGTFGYLDPEYCVSSNLNEKSDVYAFGIVLLELITGKRAIIQVSDEDKISIAEWVGNYISTGDSSSVVDPRLDGDWDADSAWTVIQIAIASTRPKRAHRPSMSDVVVQLKECVGVEKVSSRAGSFHGDPSNSETCDVIESLDFVECESNSSSESLIPPHFPQQGAPNSFSVESNSRPMYERLEGPLSKTV